MLFVAPIELDMSEKVTWGLLIIWKFIMSSVGVLNNLPHDVRLIEYNVTTEAACNVNGWPIYDS